MEAMDINQPDNPSPVVRSRPYQLVNQKVELEVSFDRRISGKTHLTLFPEYADIPGVLLNARQCEITRITVNGHKALSPSYQDPCDRLSLHTKSSVYQHHVLQEKLSGALSNPPEPELFIPLPEAVTIKENTGVVVQTADGVRTTEVNGVDTNDAEAAENLAGSAVSKYTPLEVMIEFRSIHVRDALQFAIGPPGSGRWPHVYTRGGFLPGRASCVFPCMDSLYYRCPWEISITGPRTVGDALKQIYGYNSGQGNEEARAYEAREMVFVCPGEITDDVVGKNDSSRRTVSYSISQNVSAQHIGFAIGPFEKVDLSKLREADKIELLQENAVSIAAYCLPGRIAETENTCLATTEALDHFAISHAPYPFSSFSYCFVDDHPDRPASFAGLSICSSRLLFPENVIDPAQEVTRTLIQELTTQWLGIQIIPRQAEDTWVVLGSAIFLAELFMKELCGNNEYRFRMKQMSDRVCQLDHQRPSLWDMGALLHVDPAEYAFLSMKAPLVLYILDRRIVKMIGSPKMSINIGKFMSKARNDDLKDNLLSTQDFCRVTEKVLHSSIDDFINQWVRGAGCPQFVASQKFNKKKLVIEMSIRQQQAMQTSEPDLDPDTFMRDVREEYASVYAASPQHVFTGPMTIRIHEADGTPYEHIIQIKEAVTKVEVPYNTKYKRLKRSKKQRAKNAARAENEDEQDALVYCLGDVLQSEEEIAAWQITDWSEEDEARMNAESYEWIRLDADFEWISTIRLSMPGHMFASQLQQDRDVAAQLVSIQHIEQYKAGRLISSIMLRTMMDSRYFHGIRRAAARALVKHASNENDADMIGLFHLTKAFNELYCITEGDSMMTRLNDFSDQLSYFLQCSIVEAISQVRNDDGIAPPEVKQFLLDKLKFNDNSQNEYSDAHYVSVLIKALTRALLARPKKPAEVDMEDDLDALSSWADLEAFERSCMDEIDRYRRMDEWTSSYQNLYSRTALECQATLTRAGIADYSSTHFFQYIRPGNYEMLRCTAYEILASTYMFSHDGILRKIVHGMVANNSPYVRERARAAFAKALAKRAFGANKLTVQGPPGQGLTVEARATSGPDAISVETDAARLTSIDAALEALKKVLGDNAVLRMALEEMLGFPDVGYEDIGAINDFCRMLYPVRDESKVALLLPRYWRVEREGKGKFKFSRTQKVRMKRIEPWRQKTTISFARALAEPQRKGSTMLKLKMPGSQRQSSTSAASPLVGSTSTPPPVDTGKTVLKLKLGARPSQ